MRQIYARQRNNRSGYTDQDHMVAAGDWLRHAQDASGDGGICGRYGLRRGWSSSYPETTGYIIPTLLELANELNEPDYRQRAQRCIEFLLSVQLPSGAFPGLEIADNRTEPSPFNTAQIINGLVAWHRDSNDPGTLDAMRRAGDWLLQVQDPDGAFRQHYYLNLATTYSAHASCWLAELGDYLGEDRYLEGARRHLEWTLGHVDPKSGWFDYCGFNQKDHQTRQGVTHTIAYTIWGVLLISQILGHERGLNAARAAARRMARRLELSGWLPGVINHRWRPAADYACLTGNAQMALIWMRLHELEPEASLVSSAFKAIDLVKAAHSLDNPNPGIRGGVPGSDPVWGGYMNMCIPNWAAKFFIDSLLVKQRTLAALSRRSSGQWRVPPDIPTELPVTPEGQSAQQPMKIVLYTRAGSTKPAQMLQSWAKFGFKPTALVIERSARRGWLQRIRHRLREHGFSAPRPATRTQPAGPAQATSLNTPLPNAVTLAKREGIPVIETPQLSDARALELVRQLQPDIAIHAGAGILRAPLLALPRLGTLNAHMGLLPRYRGMNVAEWAAFHRDPVGCTAHLIDPGIDTGSILCVRPVATEDANDIHQLRSLVDQAQIELLGTVVRYALATGELPEATVNKADAGVQFFRMHADLKAILERELAQVPEPVAQD